MAPEQLEGKDADARSDIFAFGAVLYEMATGHRAFEGKSQASLIGGDPKESRGRSAAPTARPPALERAVKACLEKDPDERWQTAHDVVKELKWISESSRDVRIEIDEHAVSPRGPLPSQTRSRTAQIFPWAIAAALAQSFCCSQSGDRRPVVRGGASDAARRAPRRGRAARRERKRGRPCGALAGRPDNRVRRHSRLCDGSTSGRWTPSVEAALRHRGSAFPLLLLRTAGGSRSSLPACSRRSRSPAVLRSRSPPPRTRAAAPGVPTTRSCSRRTLGLD